MKNAKDKSVLKLKNEIANSVRESSISFNRKFKLSHLSIVITVILGCTGFLIQQSSKLVTTNGLSLYAGENSKIEQLNDSNSYAHISNSLINSSNNIILNNSNNRIINPEKLTNQRSPSLPKDSNQGEDTETHKPEETNKPDSEEQEIQTSRLTPKKVALNPPPIYQVIRSQLITGSKADFSRILKQMDELKIIGKTLDYSDPKQGILKAKEWMEVTSLLAGQTDVWLEQHSVQRFNNRNYFDSMNVTKKDETTLAIKSDIALKVQALTAIRDSFNQNLEKLNK